MNTKQIGIILIIIGIVMGILTFNFIKEVSDLKHLTCPASGPECPFYGELVITTPGYLAIIVTMAVFIFGIFLILFKQTITETKKRTKPKNLTSEEKTIYEQIVKAEGTIFQSELVEKTDFSKVKVTRILDKLEGKGLIERKRRGMTNVVILK